VQYDDLSFPEQEPQVNTERIIDVGQPRKISFEKSLRFCLKGIKHRMLRSSLTQMVVVMAVAFFMVLLTESVIQSSVSKGVQGESAVVREPSLLMGHLQRNPGKATHSEHLAKGVGDEAVLMEASRVTGQSMEKIRALAELCRLEQTYLDFFETMGIGMRRILIKKYKGPDIFIHLSGPQEWTSFLEKLEPMRSLRLPTDEAVFRKFLDGYGDFRSDLEEFSSQWGEKISTLNAKTLSITQGRPLDEWLLVADLQMLASWREEVTALGFSLDKERLDRVIGLLKKTLTKDKIEMTLRSTEMIRKWRETFYQSAPLEEKMLLLEDPRVGELLGGAYSPEQRSEILQWLLYEKKLRDLEKWVDANEELSSGSIIGGRKLFLALIAFLVCVVGITNAMLMSVTERFMEIATMKCLGATDGFILKQFVLEAGFQGLLGGVLGMGVGLVVAFLKNFIQLGSSTLTYFPVSHVLIVAFTAVVSGVILAMLAAIYPSWSASRMAPMEAMRVE